jgi:hypothetical protein
MYQTIKISTIITFFPFKQNLSRDAVAMIHLNTTQKSSMVTNRLDSSPAGEEKRDIAIWEQELPRCRVDPGSEVDKESKSSRAACLLSLIRSNTSL